MKKKSIIFPGKVLRGKFPVITLFIVLLNISIFIAMSIKGVSIIKPETEDILFFGGAFAPLILKGEWWRLFSSTFIHFGCIHLIMNMYSLLYVGTILEHIIGKSRFAFAYLITGIMGNVFSLIINNSSNTVSAGASGAVFGVIGVLLPFLIIRNIIPKTEATSLLKSIGIFLAYNVIYSVKNAEIDYAAHFGGILSGFVIGCVFLFVMTKYGGFLWEKVAINALLLATLFFGTFRSITGQQQSDAKPFVLIRKKFFQTDHAVCEMERTIKKNYHSLTKDIFIGLVENKIIPELQKESALVNEARALSLSQFFKESLDRMEEWSSLKQERWKLILDLENYPSNIKYDRIKEVDRKLDKLNKM